MENQEQIPIWDMIRMVAQRVLFSLNHSKAICGRTEMSDEGQALCFMAELVQYLQETTLIPNPT